jgi:hypothetical protein
MAPLSQVAATIAACHRKFRKLLASAPSTRYPFLVNPFSMTDTDLGPNM